jgi:chitinase
MANGELAPFEWNDESTDWAKGMYERTIDLKKQNPHLKILLAVGGWNMGSTDFSNMALTATSRELFASTSVNYLKKHKFDGLDLDW